MRTTTNQQVSAAVHTASDAATTSNQPNPAGNQTKTMSPWSFIMASDAQYPWTAFDDKTQYRGNTKPYDKDDAGLYAKYQYASMKRAIELGKEEGDAPVKAVMFNGDLVKSNAHPNTDIDGFKKYYTDKFHKEAKDVPVFVGLGNHDYENYVDDTYQNRGASQMVCFADDNLQRDEIKKHVKRAQFLEVPDRDGKLQTRLIGSYAYSFEIEGIHFVQLNNYPGYERSWSGYNSDKARKYICKVNNSLSWLEDDLARARSEGKAVIVCMHKPISNWSEDASDLGKCNADRAFVS